jgi:hypothetical protein
MLTTEPSVSQPKGAGFPAFDRAFQTALKNNTEDRLAALIGQWDVLIVLFKHTFEIPVCGGIMVEPSQKRQHRAFLSQLMGMGESILHHMQSIDGAKVAETGYTVLFVESNVKYLREKYEEHFFSYDTERIEADRQTIWNALASTHKRDTVTEAQT